MKKNHSSTRAITPRISSQINQVGDNLANTFRVLLDSLPGQPAAAREMAQILSVDKILVHKVLNALSSKDPLATAHSMPGPEPLMRVVKAAKAKGAPKDVVKAAEAAVTSFKHLIKNQAGDRSDLDAIITTLMPEARGRFESVAKQSVYRGMRQLKGFAAEVMFITFIIHQQSQGDRFDFVSLRGFQGLRCVRPGTSMKVSVISDVTNMDASLLTMDGEPLTDPQDVVLPKFCSGPAAEFEVYEKHGARTFLFGWGESVGRESTCNLVVGERRRNAMRRWRAPDDDRKRTGVNCGIRVPTRMYIFDLLLEEDVYPDWIPSVRVLELGEQGDADPNDELRELDAIDLDVQVKTMGYGVERFRAREIPKYLELLNYTCEKAGIASNRLRGYRTRIEYPVFGTQVLFSFDVPVKAPSARTNVGEG